MEHRVSLRAIGSPGHVAVARRVCVGTGLALLLLASCTRSKAPATVLPPAFAATVPNPPPLTLSAVEQLLQTLRNPQTQADNPLLYQPVSASAFAVGSPEPDANNPQWMGLMDKLVEVRATALAEGWCVQVDGWADASGPEALNLALSQARADTTRSDIIAVGYPPACVAAAGRGVGGPNATDRRVEVQFVRASTPGISPAPAVSS